MLWIIPTWADCSCAQWSCFRLWRSLVPQCVCRTPRCLRFRCVPWSRGELRWPWWDRASGFLLVCPKLNSAGIRSRWWSSELGFTNCCCRSSRYQILVWCLPSNTGCPLCMCTSGQEWSPDQFQWFPQFTCIWSYWWIQRNKGSILGSYSCHGYRRWSVSYHGRPFWRWWREWCRG